MILKVKRTKYSGAKEEYVILDKNNNLVKNCNLENEKEFSKFNLNYNNEEILLNIPKSYSNFSTITKNNNEIGKIESGNKEKTISNNYYWDMSFDTRNFKLYEIGFGSKGLYLVIKEEEKTIAIISSTMIVKDFKDSYELFIEEDKDSIVAILGCIYWNLYRGTNIVKEGISAAGTINKVLNTTSKKILNKMDYAFIEKISKEENYISNNENKKSTTYQIVGWSIFVAFIIFLIVMLIIQ